jgi:hypothetical protein
MSTALQLRRGTTAQHATFTGALGEVSVDTDKDVVVVHDGSTAGGFPAVGGSNGLVNGLREPITVAASAATGTINYDQATQSILYYTTNASANWTLNVRGNSGATLNSRMAIGESLTITFMATQGATAYYQSALQIDGSAVTPKWQGGSAPTSGNASGIDVYSFSIIKTANATFTVLASQTQFK